MADNVQITEGSGPDIATDDVGGRHYQIIKVAHGVDGVANDATETTPLPVHDHDAEGILLRMATLLGTPPGFDRSINRGRTTATIDGGTLPTVTAVGTVTTVTTVSTVTAVTNMNNLNFLGAQPAQALVVHQTNTAWALMHRARIT